MLCLASAGVLSACSDNDDDPTLGNPVTPSNNAPVVEDGSLKLKAGREKTLQLSASDPDGDVLSYAIGTAPASGTASVDDSGMLTYSAVADGNYTVGVEVSDGQETTVLTVAIEVANTAPTAKNAQLALPVRQGEDGGKKASFQVSASDSDKDPLSYSVSTQPAAGSASIDALGMVTIDVSDAAETNDVVVVDVTDGEDVAQMTLSITRYIDTGDIDASDFSSQFYKVVNPETTNSQIVHYNADTSEQTVIKSNVALGQHVFIMGGVKEAGKTQYTNREYGIFLDPNAASEKREASDGAGGTYEYQFFTDHSLKAFEANNTASERVIFNADALSQDLKNAGIQVVDASTVMHLNEVDISNSYVRLKVYDQLADPLRGEIAETMLHLPVTVRLSDGAHTPGHPVALLKNEDGTTSGVLVTYVAPHKMGEYPQDAAQRKRLQVCDTALANCNDVANADGNYFLLAQSASYVYMTKDGSSAIYAFAVADNTLTEVSGVTFPANFDHHHHTLSLYSDGGHGSGLFRDFFNLMNAKSVVTEGDSAYVAINYDLDTQEPVAPGPYDAYGLHVYLHKHAMVLKLTGTEGVKVYDNGDGIDHGNASNETDTGRSLHLSLNAVRDGNLLLEGAHFNGGDDCGSEYNCMKYVQGWLNTNDVTTTKTAFDNTVLENDIPYLTAYRVPPVVIGDHAYLNQSVGNSTSSRVYTVYKMPLGDIDVSVDDPSVTSILGRMYFERTAFGSDGTFDGSVLLWERSTGDVIDATNNVVIGNDSDIKAEGETLFSVIARSSTDNRAGVGGLFGLKMSAAHGATPYLVSGASNSDGSLVKVNHISGSWIID